MRNVWILDVLADLKSFARNNDMGALAEQLDDAMLVAAGEIASSGRGDTRLAGHDEYTAGDYREPGGARPVA